MAAEDRERYEVAARLRMVEAERAVYLEMFGDKLAERQGYRELRGLDAVYYYVVREFRWTPAQVRSMTFDDLEFILTEEMSGWTVPKELRGLFPNREQP